MKKLWVWRYQDFFYAIHSLWYYSYRGKVTRPCHKELKIRNRTRESLDIIYPYFRYEKPRERDTLYKRQESWRRQKKREKEKERILRPLSVQGGWRHRWQHLPTLINDARSQRLMSWGVHLSFSVFRSFSLTFFSWSVPSMMVSPQHALKFETQPTAVVDPAALLNPHARTC